MSSLNSPDAQALAGHVAASLESATRFEEPYRHWLLADIFDVKTVEELSRLPFPVAGVDGVSGARELHNDTRQYFDVPHNAQHPVCARVAEAFQSPELVGRFEAATGSSLAGCYLRIELSQDTDGFWLKAHTDIGVKKFTMLVYLPESDEQADLGTDIYADADTWVKTSPFERNLALLFIPSTNTWHGFAPKPIKGVRRSVIINYVTDEWRAREQLAYPDAPVRSANS